MAKTSEILTARQVDSAKPKPGRKSATRLSDGDNLYLSVSPSGGRSWVFIYRWHKRTIEAGLGKAGKGGVTLAEARRKAEQGRAWLNASPPVNPLDAWRKPVEARRVPTFAEAARDYIETHAPAWRNAKHKAQWTMTLLGGAKLAGPDGIRREAVRNAKRAYCASLHNLPCDKIDTRDVIGVLKPLWTRAPETASRLRGRIESVLKAQATLRRADGETGYVNPAQWRGHLDTLLPAPRKLASQIGKGKHHRALAYQDVPALVGRLRKDTGVAASALEFAILTAVRPGEVIGATWAEIDLGERVWTIPPERMKAGKEHRVPLSARALAIVEDMRKFGDAPRACVFPGRFGGKPLSDMALLALLRRMGVDSTAHGFRSSFRDWTGNETATPREVAEAALAHAVGDKSEQAYRRQDALMKRRALMDAWAAYCEPRAPETIDGPGGNVIGLREARAARA